MSPPAELRAELARLAPHLGRAGLFSLAIGLLSLVPVVYMLQVYDRVVNSRSVTTLVMLTLLVLGLYAVMAALEWTRSAILAGAGRQLEARLGERVFEAVFEANLSGGQGGGGQPVGDLGTLRDFLVGPALPALLEAPLALLFLLAVFWVSPALAVFALLGAALQTALTWLTERRAREPLAEAQRQAIAAREYAAGVARNAEVIEAMGMLEAVHGRWLARQGEALRLQALASDRAGSLSAIARSAHLILASALLGLGCWFYLQGDLAGGGGMIIVGSILGGKVLQPLTQLLAQWPAVIQARDAYDRLTAFLERQPARQPGMPLPPPRGQLRLEAVCAGAPGSREAILRDLDFSLPAGECLAVIGPSASGKTTLARLLMGLWPPLSGSVRLDGADIHAWHKAELGPHLGYLPQDVELFDGTLAENICRFGPVAMDQVEAAAELIGLDSLAAELPDGYASRIGEAGAFLSGGQRQRVGIARAIYGAPRFVVLDEPNASLDDAGEARLLDLLAQLKARGTTVVVVTHRPHVLAAADRVLILGEGRMRAYGPRDSVLAALRQAQDGGRGRPA